MADDDFVEGDAHSEPADAPDTDAPARGDAKQGGFDSSSVSDAPVMHRPKSAGRMAAARSAFAAAVLANKDKPAKPASDNDILDPDEPAPIAAKADTAKAKADAAPVAPAEPAAAPVAAPVAPPAPSLDPEVRKLRETLAAERQQLAAERAELEKAKAVKAEVAAPATATIETYLDHAPTAVRNWLDEMRGDKLSDDDFKSEVADLITMLSGDVLGVPLPENVRVKLEAAQAKKMVRTHKTLQTRKEQEAAARAEKERLEQQTKAEAEAVEREWVGAAKALSGQFTAAESKAAASYPWLAAEDDPGSIIVDVIRAALNRDGTQLKWDEAAKQANDYLAEHAKKYYDKRKPLLGGAVTPAAKPAAQAAKPVEAAKPVAPPVSTTPSGNTRWSNDKHREQTKAAFRQMLGKTD